jgi:hypothetical protein
MGTTVQLSAAGRSDSDDFKRGKDMKFNKPQTIQVPKTVKDAVIVMIKNFDYLSACYLGVEHNTRIAPELLSDTKPVIKNSLAGAICTWIMENPETSVSDWYRLQDKIKEKNPFLKHGYKNLKAPNLSWMFSSTRGGEMGLVRVISGAYDNWKHEQYSDADMV